MLSVAAIAASPAYAQEKPAPTDVPAAEAQAISGDDLKAFVRASAADAMGAADTAAAGYSVALGDVPSDVVVAYHAYRQALAAGDYALASRAAAALEQGNSAPTDTAVLDFANALKANDRVAAQAAIARMAKGPLVFMVPVLNSWMAVDRGEDPIAGLDVHAGGALLRRYGTEHRALLLLATGQTAQGMTALDAILESSGEDGDDLRIDAAELLQGMGKRKEAKALLAQTRVGLSVSRGGIGRGAKPGAAFGASRLFLGLAVDLAQQDLVDLSIALTRAALLIDPSEDRARLYLAEALSRAGSDRIAIDVLAQVPRGSPFARGAAAGRVAALRRAGRMAEAIAGAKAMAEDRDSLASDAQNYGDLLMADAQYDAAAAAYAVALKRAGGDGGWGLHFLRGSALDRAGKWDEALPELHRAVELAPNEAAAVTYLGYALVEHRGDLSEAQGLLERAKRLKPGDAGITDSLAWTYYLRGDTARALPMLEEAARADPGGALVNEHLGDVYWKLGRRYEARYAWRAAAIYAAEADGARIEAKLRDGLTASN